MSIIPNPGPAAKRFRAGDRVYVAGHLNTLATFLEYIDDGDHALVQLHGHAEETPVAVSFLTLAHPPVWKAAS